MGFRFRKSFKIGPARMTFSKSGVSHSIGGKGFRITKTAKGRTKTTLSIPGTGLSYTSESGGRKAKSPKGSYRSGSSATYHATKAETSSAARPDVPKPTKRPANPPKPPKSPGIYRVCGIILLLCGVIFFAFFWPLGLAVIAFGAYYIACGPKIYSKLVENYRAVHPEFDENTRR